MKPCRLLGFQAGVIVYSTEYTFHHCYQITTRYNIQTGMTACYPSSGGIWLADLGPVELPFLEIHRFDSTERSWSEAEEDQFRRELRKFGSGRNISEIEPVFSIDRKVAFPAEGGVWVLGRNEETGRYPCGIVGVYNELKMEKRSMGLERLGAFYRQDLAKSPPLDDLKKEPRDLAGNQDL
ncbi:hypothetical protein PEBR_24036 [Penicillium brasilianum]|uniref:Uncharacterized protein n=1 Tax=Penicillium brasilianum TaxID=104259 RepID=A0A1S9RK60_PENBI|nr:hypothetical protein PEBR_24036 [Penicillium brasilianum]